MTDGTKPLKSGIGHLKNNAHPLWWRDPGLRKLTIGILVGFCGSVQTGMSSPSHPFSRLF